MEETKKGAGRKRNTSKLVSYKKQKYERTKEQKAKYQKMLEKARIQKDEKKNVAIAGDNAGDESEEMNENEYERIATSKPIATELARMPKWKMGGGKVPKQSMERTLVYFVFEEVALGWLWLATHWDAESHQFYGYVIMYEREWGPFEMPPLTHVLIRLPSIERKLPLPVGEVLLRLHRKEKE